MDSTMYRFSGDETCVKATPARSVMSVKRGPGGCCPAAFGAERSNATTNARSTHLIIKGQTSVITVRVLRVARGARLLLQLPGEFQLSVAVGLAPGGEVGAAELEVDVGLAGREPRGGLQALDRALHVAQLEQRLAQLEVRVAEVGLVADDLAQKSDAAAGLLAGQQDVAEIVSGLNVGGIEGQLRFKLLRGLVELPRLQLGHAEVEVRESRPAVQRECRPQLLDGFGGLAPVVIRLAEQDVQLGAVAA